MCTWRLCLILASTQLFFTLCCTLWFVTIQASLDARRFLMSLVLANQVILLTCRFSIASDDSRVGIPDILISHGLQKHLTRFLKCMWEWKLNSRAITRASNLTLRQYHSAICRNKRIADRTGGTQHREQTIVSVVYNQDWLSSVERESWQKYREPNAWFMSPIKSRNTWRHDFRRVQANTTPHMYFRAA